ncbi:SHOCT domain-containing protein [Thermovenabulum gondwanense]|nr:SHOCT domain-containing protein [Thermovenabulum gondwanense]
MYFMMFLWVLFWAAVIYVIYKFIKSISINGANKRINLTETPMEILKKRYAAGEITKEEYEKIKEELDKT